MRRAVLAKEDRVMREDIHHAEMRQSGEDDGAVGITNEVEEGGAEGYNAAVGRKAVADG